MKLDTIIAERDNKTVYRDGDLCYKVFGSGFSKGDILNEALNYARAEETGLNVPKIKGVAEVDGRWAMITEYIDGVTLESLISESPSGLDEYLDMFVDLQIGINSKSSEQLFKLRDKLHAKISQSGLSATERYELHTQLEAMPRHKKLCHGDYNPSNIIISKDGTPYIIDWAHAAQGNASADAARTYLLFKINGDDSGAEKYLNMFCKKTDTAAQYVRKWLPIEAAAQITDGEKNKINLLKLWINVVDYD